MQYLEIKHENEAVVASGNYIFLNHHYDKLNTQKTKKNMQEILPISKIKISNKNLHFKQIQ